MNLSHNSRTKDDLIQEMICGFASDSEKILHNFLKAQSIKIGNFSVSNQMSSTKRVFVSAFFTGIVFGEFILAMSEQTAQSIVTVLEDQPAKAVGSVEQMGSLCEVLNLISGQSIARLGKYYDKLTLTSPRIYFGQLLYPMCLSGKVNIETDFGDVECHFYLDEMELDLAISYRDALQSLIGTNRALTQANEKLKSQQSQLVHSEKMASLGVMAAGVAHEINNPLAYVDSNISTLEDYSTAIQQLLRTHEVLLESFFKKNSGEFQKSLNEIKNIKKQEDFGKLLSDTREIFDETRSGVRRIKEIVTGLKKFSHVDTAQPKPVDLNEEIDSILKLVSNQLRYKCEVIRHFGEVPNIMAYPGQLSQVFVNLLVNAAQAMPEMPEALGKITVSTRQDGGNVVIDFADTGTGIAPEHLDKIFDPFFSTKKVGEGTGLGLAISYGIVRDHGGKIQVQSELGKGTVFTISLPINGKAT